MLQLFATFLTCIPSNVVSHKNIFCTSHKHARFNKHWVYKISKFQPLDFRPYFLIHEYTNSLRCLALLNDGWIHVNPAYTASVIAKRNPLRIHKCVVFMQCHCSLWNVLMKPATISIYTVQNQFPKTLFVVSKLEFEVNHFHDFKNVSSLFFTV